MQTRSRYKWRCRTWEPGSKSKCVKSRSFVIIISILIAATMAFSLLVKPSTASSDSNGNLIVNQNQQLQRDQTKPSSQLLVSQVCAGKSQFPYSNQVESVVLISNADKDVNCTMTFRSRSAYSRFVIRFEKLSLGCGDRLRLFDGDAYYGQRSFADLSCKDSLANVVTMQTTGTFLTVKYMTDSKALESDGFKFIATAVYHETYACPIDHAHCRGNGRYCISKSLLCDGINNCLDNSDEQHCPTSINGQADGGWFSFRTNTDGDLSLSNALVLLVVLVLIIFACVILFIVTVNCRRENHYAAQYQHHLQATAGVPYGVPLQTSPSVMFAPHPQHWSNHHILNQPPITVPCHIVYDTVPRTNALLHVQNQ